MAEYYLRRQCQTLVRRTHRFLWWTWETEKYEYSPEHVGSYFVGPYSTPEAAKRWGMYKPTDVVVPTISLAPELIMLLTERNAQPLWRLGHQEVYLSPDNIAHPLELLRKLRDVWYLDDLWKSVAFWVGHGDEDHARRSMELIDRIAAHG